MTPSERARLISTLIYHQRFDVERCACGWSELGRSHAAHVVEIYEEAVRYETEPPSLFDQDA